MQSRDTKKVQYKSPIIITHEQLGIGTTVQLLPAINHLKTLIDNEIILCCFKHHVPIIKYFIDDDNIYPFIQKIYDTEFKYKTDPIYKGTESLEYNTGASLFAPHTVHHVDHYFRMLFPGMADIALPMELKNYLKFPVEKINLSKFNLPENYVAFSPTFTKPSCNIPSTTQNEILAYCLHKGYTPVILGDDYTFDIIGKGITDKGQSITVGPKINKNFSIPPESIDLLTETSLPETIAIMANAKCYIGPEGGLMHMCGLTDTPMVIPFTSMSPKTRMPYRHNKLGWEVYPVLPDLECQFCITNTIHRKSPVNVMMECLFDDFKCIEKLTFDRFKIQLDKIL
tara:strand:- start:1184 stop:2206 length:1023 start_codon:yes stop_codon:yes gene_type:complete